MDHINISDPDEWFDLSFEQKLAALKQTITVPEVAELAGLDITAGDKIISPWNPSERTPSAHLYEDHIHCYSTGQGGDIFDLVVAINPGATIGDAVKMLHRRAVSVGKEYGDVELAQPRMRKDFRPDIDGFFQLKEFNGINLAGFNVRKSGAEIRIPHQDAEGIYGVKIRNPHGKSSLPGSQFTLHLYDPYGMHYPITGVDTLVICEGESDCWAMERALNPTDSTVDVWALPSGAATWKEHWLAELQPYQSVWVCMDNDQAGKRARDKLMSKIGYERTRELRVPQLYGDAREALAAGWQPDLSA